MKNLKIEIKDQNDIIVGYVFRFRGAAFTNFATAYTPLDVNGNPLPGNCQPSFEAARQKILSHDR
jgi:hypothetical protein